jgi:hypothetical protein
MVFGGKNDIAYLGKLHVVHIILNSRHKEHKKIQQAANYRYNGYKGLSIS